MHGTGVTNRGCEVHGHCFVSGPRSRRPNYEFSHSHEGGSAPHRHPDCGPSHYTIDKDEWFAATGMRGGGRKKFTVKAAGEQMEWIELDERQKTFEVIIAQPPGGQVSEGPGIALPMRMMLAFRMSPKVREL